MARRFLIGLDAGGGSGRCLLVDVDSAAVTIATRSWSHLPASESGWAYDLDLDFIWQALGEATREAMQRAGAAPDEVVGIAATSMRHGLVVLGKDGKALLATPNRDARAADIGMDLAAERGREFYQRTGHFPTPIFAACRLKWMAESTPEAFANAGVILNVSEWVTFRLCGRAATDPSHAGETMLFDLPQRDWAWDLIKSLDLPRGIFPKVEKAGTRLGKLTAEAAANLGLRAGTSVAVGGGDTQCGLLGSGAVKPRQLGIVAGTTAPLQLVVDQPILDPQSRLWTGQHVIPGQYVLESNAGASGEGLEWIARVLYPEARKAVAMLDAEAAQSLPGAAGMVSTFGAQVFDGSNMSLPFGYLAISHMVAGNDATRRRHLVRSVLEGLAYAVRANADQIIEVSGVAQPEYFLTGGMSRSPVWPQMLADVLNRPVTVARYPDATALGAAICAGVGAGVFHNLAAGSAALAIEPGRLTPTPEAAETYQEIYEEWIQFRTAHADADAIAGSLLMKGITGSQARGTTRRVPAFKPRMLVTAQMDETAIARLRRVGEVTYQNYREAYTVLTGDDLVEAMQGRQVLVTEVDVVDADALAKLPDLRLVASCRGNAVNIDTAACTAFGVPVLNTPGRNADAVADLAVAFMLMLARKLAPAAQFLHDPQGEAGDLARMGAAYSQFQGIELWRKAIGLIGMGAIGRGVIRRLLPFGARVLVYDPYVTSEQATLAGAEWVTLETLLRESDIVSLHAPVNAQTAGMLGAERFAQMKRGAFLVNTARAALVDEAALAAALRSGHLGGAALDVFSAEPPGPDDPLLTAPNVVATPHLGGNTCDVAAHQGEIIADELERILAGEQPRFLLNPETFENFSWTLPRPVPSADRLAQLRASGGPAVSDLDARPHKNLTAESAEKNKPSALAADSAVRTTVPAEKGNQTAMLEKILRRFLADSEKDSALLAFAANRVFSMHYLLTDANLDFHMLFNGGLVRAGMGAPSGKPDLTLKMKAELFDGMMTGKVNATTAAMSGKLKFSGDTGKAMQMQRIQKDIMRLYTEARQEIGDPGDLSKLGTLPAAPALPPAVAVPRVVQAGVAAAPAVAKAGDERDDLVATVQELYDMNLITATGGNISVRIGHPAGQLWITPSLLFKGNLRPELMVRINMEGEPLDEDADTPSSERWVHTEILKARPDLNAVIHAHAPWATLLALTETPFLPVSTEAAFIGDIPRVPFIMPGTRELAVAVARAIGEKGSVALMQNHGLVVAGSSLRRAASTTEVVERYSELILRSLMLGKQPPVLPDEVVKSLREMGEMMA